MPIPGILEWRQLQELLGGRILERLAALEAKLATEGQQPRPLRQRNATRQVNGERLRKAIADVVAKHTGPGPMSAKTVLRGLERSGVSPLPSDRTVRWHMRALRGNGNTAVLPT